MRQHEQLCGAEGTSTVYLLVGRREPGVLDTELPAVILPAVQAVNSVLGVVPATHGGQPKTNIQLQTLANRQKPLSVK